MMHVQRGRDVSAALAPRLRSENLAAQHIATASQ